MAQDKHESWKKLRSLRKIAKRKNKKKFIDKLRPLISNWQGRLPNLLNIFPTKEIDWLLTEAAKNMKYDEAKSFIEFVARSGYKVKPRVSKSGKRSSRRTTPLHHLCRRDSWPFSTNLPVAANWLFDIYDGIDVNYIDKSGLTHFHVACAFGRTDVVKKFLELGQDPNLMWPEEKCSPLHLAVQRQRREVAELLLRAGADPNSVDGKGKTSLNVISEIHGDVVLAKMLFELSDEKYRVQVDHLASYKSTSPLHAALYYDYAELARFLLEMGADPNLADYDGYNALHHVCMMREGNDDALAEMIFGNDDYEPLQINARNKKGYTPLHLAVKKGASNLVQVLLRRGADSSATNEKGMTPLHLVCKKWPEPTLLNLFLRINDELGRPVSIDALDNRDRTPLVWAVACRNMRSAEVLLRRGADPSLGTPLNHLCHYDDHWLELFFDFADRGNRVMNVNARDDKGDTALHVAASCGIGNATELLLRRGGDPNLVDNDGKTALHLICERFRDDDLAERFFAVNDEIGQRVLMNVRDKLGNAPLHLALSRGHRHLVGLLLSRGSDPNSSNRDGSTPLHVICQRNRDDDLVELFLNINHLRDRQVYVNTQDCKNKAPLHLALSRGHKRMTKSLLRRCALTGGSFPLHVICQRDQDDGFASKYFELNRELNRLVELVDARDQFGRTPLQLALTSLLPDAIDALLANGAALPSVFPSTADDFRQRFNSIEYDENYVKLRIASGILVVLECLHKHGYEMDRTDAVAKIMKLFADIGLYENWTSLEKYWYDDVRFADKSRETMVVPDVSLYDLMELSATEAAKRVAPADYFKFACSMKWDKFTEKHGEACVLHLCELMWRKIFLHRALDPFMELTHYRLPALCCDMIIQNLDNQDLCNICLAASSQSS